MHSHCVMSNEKESEKEAKHQCVTMQTLTALNRMSPWTTCMLWLRTVEDVLWRGSWAQTWANHPTLSATPADSLDFSWGLTSCCALICQSSSSPSLGGGELWYTIQQPSDTESSVKGRPLRPFGCLFRPHAAHISMTNMWLLMDDLPLRALGRSGEQQRIACWDYTQFKNIMFMFHYFKFPFLSGDFAWWASWISEVMLVSSCDILLTGGNIAWGGSEGRATLSPSPQETPRVWGN